MVIFGVAGLIPNPGGMSGPERLDLILHLGGWIVGAVSGRLAFPRRRSAFLFAALWSYSLAIELVQSLVPGRGFDFLDLAANAAGIVVGLAAGRVVRDRLP